MGALLDKPKTEKHSEAGCGNGLRYGLSSMQGWRIEMEDAHTALANLQGDLKVRPCECLTSILALTTARIRMFCY